MLIEILLHLFVSSESVDSGSDFVDIGILKDVDHANNVIVEQLSNTLSHEVQLDIGQN